MALRLPLDHEAYALSGLPMFRSRVRAWSRADVIAGIEVLRRRVSCLGDGWDKSPAGLPENPRWVLSIRDRAKFTVASVAAWADGAIPVAPAHARSGVMQLAPGEPRVVVTDDAEVAASLRGAPHLVDLSTWPGPAGDDGVAVEDRALPPWGHGWDDEDTAEAIAWVFETSGSRGEATLHPRSRRAIQTEAQTLVDLLALRPGRRVVGTAPPTHLYGALFTIVAPLLAGCTVVCESPLHAGELVAALVETRASVLVSTPAHLAALMATEARTLIEWTSSQAFEGAERLDVVSSGATLPEGLAERLASLPNVRVTEILGATETGGIASRRWPERRYRALTGVAWRHREDVFEVTSPWCRGSDDSYVPTREDVQLVDDTYLVHHGRTDDVVKVGGRRVSLGALDEALRAIPGVEDVALTSIADDGPRGNEIVGVVVAPGVRVGALLDELRRSFDPVVIPRRLRHVARIDRDDRGKLPGARVLAAWQHAMPVDFELAARLDEDGAVLVTVPEPTAWTQGHFRRDAVVPGAALLSAVTRVVEARVGGEVRELRGVKFHAKVLPGDTLRVVMQGARDGEDAETVLQRVEATRADTMVLRAELVLAREAAR